MRETFVALNNSSSSGWPSAAMARYARRTERSFNTWTTPVPRSAF
jgi:hypothetical protein